MRLWFKKMSGASSKPQPNPLLAKIRELSLGDGLDENEPKPAAATIQQAETLLSQSWGAIAEFGLEDADIHSVDGAVRIVWTQEGRTLKLIVPPSGNAYLFHKDGESHNIVQPVSAGSVNQWLKWLSGVSAYALSSTHV